MNEPRRTPCLQPHLPDRLVALAKELVPFPDRLVALLQISIAFGAQDADPRLSLLQLKSKLLLFAHSAYGSPYLDTRPDCSRAEGDFNQK